MKAIVSPRVTTQELWRRLHYHALHEFDPLVSGAAMREATWLLKWARDIPTYNGGGCRCKEHWNQWYAKNRPTAADYASAEAYFAWTVKAHNSVNERLKKPILTVDEAKLLYPKRGHFAPP